MANETAVEKAQAIRADGLQIRFLADPKTVGAGNNHGHDTGEVAVVSKPRAIEFIRAGVAELAE